MFSGLTTEVLPYHLQALLMESRSLGSAFHKKSTCRGRRGHCVVGGVNFCISGLSSQFFTLLQFVTPFSSLLFAPGQRIYDVKSQSFILKFT